MYFYLLNLVTLRIENRPMIARVWEWGMGIEYKWVWGNLKDKIKIYFLIVVGMIQLKVCDKAGITNAKKDTFYYI